MHYKSVRNSLMQLLATLRSSYATIAVLLNIVSYEVRL